MTEFVGFCVYEKDAEPGTLNASWVRSSQDHSEICPGTATGGPKQGFAGRYRIIYTEVSGETSVPCDLIIRSVGQIFRLSWERDGRVLSTGIGFLVSGKLAFGWGPA